jgi:hypothetical protein
VSLTKAGPGTRAKIPAFRTESAGLSGGAAASSGVATLRDVTGSVLNAPPSLITPILSIPFTQDAGTNRFLAGVGMIVFAAATTNYNSFGGDVDGNALTINPLGAGAPSIFQNVGFKAHGFGFSIALGTGGALASTLNINIGRFGGAGNFDVFIASRLYQFGNQVDAANLTNQYASVLQLNATPIVNVMDSTVNTAGDLLFSCACTANPVARNPLKMLPVGTFNYGTTQVDGEASMNLADNNNITGVPVATLWDWGLDPTLGSYGNQWVVGFSP